MVVNHPDNSYTYFHQSTLSTDVSVRRRGMNMLNPFESETNQTAWTPHRVAHIGSPYYPLCESGPLCPLLDDENLLYDFYAIAGLRKNVKRFCKTHRWHGKPSVPNTMTEEALKRLLRSMCNSSEARRMLRESYDSIALHNAIWAWLGVTDNVLFETAKSFSHLDKFGKYFMTAGELEHLLTNIGNEGSSPVNPSLLYLALAFAMLQTEGRFELIAKVVAYFPDSATSLGLPGETEESNDASPSPPEFESQVLPNKKHAPEAAIFPTATTELTSEDYTPCWAPRTNDIALKTHAIAETAEQFAAHAQRLATIDELLAFGDPGEAASLLLAIASERRDIFDQSQDVLSLFAKSCNDPESAGCELLRFARKIQDKPPTTISALVAAADAMRQLADALLCRAQTARKADEELRKEAAAFSAILRLPEPSPQPTDSSAAPCTILAAASAQRKRTSDLRTKLSAEIMSRKDGLAAECERLGQQYNLNADTKSPDSPSAYEDLRSRIASAEDMRDVQACETLLANLHATCRAAEHLDAPKLASRLQKQPEDLRVFLDLCRTLITRKLPEVAYLLLYVRQRVCAFEEITEDPDQALSILLDTGCAAASGDLPTQTMWKTLSEAPWLISVEHDDIGSSDLLERIVVASIGTALAGEAENAATVLVKIGAVELSRQSLPGQVQAVIQAIVARRPVRIASPEEFAEAHRQELHLRESIAFEGRKYRHLQCGKSPHFVRFESGQVFPALSELWDATSSDLRAGQYDAAQRRVATINVDDWYATLVNEFDKPVHDHPFFSVKIREYMQSFVTSIQAYVALCRKIWGGEFFVLGEDDLIGALKQWSGTQEGRNKILALIARNQGLSASTTHTPTPFWRAIALCPSVVQKCPHFVTWLRAQQEPTPTLQLQQLLLSDLALERPALEAASILEAHSAWEHLSVLFQSMDAPPHDDWASKHQSEIDELTARRKEVFALNDAGIIATFDECLQEGRLPAAFELVAQCDHRTAQARAKEKEAVSSFIHSQLKKIDDIKDLAADANMAPAWRDAASRSAGKVEMQLRGLRRSEHTSEALQANQARLVKAVDALCFLVRENSQGFDEVDALLGLLPTGNSPAQITTTDKERASERCPDLYSAWNNLASPDSLDYNDTQRSWAQFVREFAKVCNLYYDEHDERKRFATVSSINYPFKVYQTAFYKPQSEFLKRPLRLYIYRPRNVDIPALQRLEAELSSGDSAAWLHVVFAPQGLEKVQRYFNYDTGFKDFLLVGETFLYRVILAEKHDVPVRQALHASVTELTSSTPFVAQGYCHQSNNIYVGRKDILQKLLNTPQAMIWGGRRIGKTSVLHALEGALRNRNYCVAYVYVDLDDDGDPDLSIAQKIGVTLGLPQVDSISEFERQVTRLRIGGSRLAFLIDEVDEYIKKSREVHGEAFPLATTLRQLVMDDSSKDTILVYSGYHQLYYEAKLNKGKRRVGHPFINITQDIPIRNLTHDDVKELVTTGFEEMLDIGVSPEVAPLIFKRASSHPAFVQQFCRCLLERASKRRSPGTRVTISSDDVEAVYAANASREGGEQPFIFYVNETLGYNLSHLGRAIMLAICYMLRSAGQTGHDDRYFPIERVDDEVKEWCEILGVARPEPEHFEQTMELLVMTNMLTQSPDEHDKYRVTYPTYVDILHRLDKLKRTALEHSLQAYDTEERTKGVLL